MPAKMLSRLFGNLRSSSRTKRHIATLVAGGQYDHALAHVALCSNLAEADWLDIASMFAAHANHAGHVLLHALRLCPQSFALTMACGDWHRKCNRPLLAYQFYDAAHRMAPAESSPFHARGEIHLTLGNYRSAIGMFIAALQRNEHAAESAKQLELARQLAALPLAKTSAVISATEELQLRDAAANAPEDYSSLLAYGRILTLTARSGEALPLLETAHRLSGEDVDTALWLATAFANMSMHEEALVVTEKALLRAPDNLDLLELSAECAALTSRDAEAVGLYQRLLACKPTATIWNNLGSCLSHLEQFEASLGPLKNALLLEPDLLAAKLNLGYSLSYLGRNSEACDFLDQVLAVEKNDFEARWYRSNVLLAEHKFAEGWRDYEYRFVSNAVRARPIPFLPWLGQPIAGKKIAVIAEQGIGDEIMFASCLPELLNDDSHVVLECSARLANLFSRSFPGATIVLNEQASVPEWTKTHEDTDYFVFAGSLPLYFRTEASFFERTRFPYLTPSPEIVSRSREQIGAAGSAGSKLKVGIAWRGGTMNSRMRSRSLSLVELAPILKLENCEFFSVQYGDHAAEIEDVGKQLGVRIHSWPELIADLDSYAAMIVSLDVIVTVCSAAVHFAGALGKPAITLAPHRPEWRYFSTHGKMLWYPSVALLTQPAPGVWQPVIEQAAKLLLTHALPVTLNDNM